MFRISKLKTSSQAEAVPPERVNEPTAGLGRFYLSDQWVGDLANGLFQLGKISEQLHGLDTGECGLLTLLRCYEPADRVNILELLETASSSPSSFCFSTHIVTGPSERQPLLCIGESGGFDENGAANMSGVFVFPKLVAEMAGAH